MKKLFVLVTCLNLLLSIFIIQGYAETPHETERTPTYTNVQFAGYLDQWGPFTNDGPKEEGPQGIKVDGEGIDEKETDIKIIGGKLEGGYIFSFNSGNLCSGTHGPDNAYCGAIDASSFTLTYKSNRDVYITFKSEWRITPTDTYESNKVLLPSTNGIFQTLTLPLSDFEKPENGKWIYAMEGKYQTTNFNPVITFNVHGITSETEIQFHTFAFNWYAEDMVSNISIHDYKTDYWQNRDVFNFNQGSVTVIRGGISEEIALNDRRIEIKGFDNTKLGQQKLTLRAYNKTIDFYINIHAYEPDNLTKIEAQNIKTDYLVNEDFDYKTGSILAIFSDGNTETIPLDHPNVTISNFNTKEPVAEQTITIHYGGKTTTFTISVRPFTVEGPIHIEGARRLYKVGDTFDWHSGKIVPEKGTIGNLFSPYADIEGFDSSKETEDQIITVHYGGQTTTYTIDIIKDSLPVRYALNQNMKKAQCWKWGGQMHHLEVVDKKAENLLDPAIYIQGDGTHGGGGAIVFTDSDFGSGDTITSDNKTLTGFIGADAMRISYKNTFTPSRASNYAQYAPKFSFRLEYENSSIGTRKDSQSFTLPVTKTNPDDPQDPGYWIRDYIIPLSTFDGTDKTQETAESIDWLYNMKSAFVEDEFNPSIQWRMNGKLLDGDELYFDKIEMLWLEDEPVKSISVSNPQTSYKRGEPFNKAQGELTIYYKDKIQPRKTTLQEVQVTGFDSINGGTEQKITISYAGKSTSFMVEVGDPLVDTPKMYKKVNDSFKICEDMLSGETYQFDVAISGELVKETTDILIIAAGYDENGQIVNLIDQIPITINPGSAKQQIQTQPFIAEDRIIYKFFVIDKNTLTPYLNEVYIKQTINSVI